MYIRRITQLYTTQIFFKERIGQQALFATLKKWSRSLQLSTNGSICPYIVLYLTCACQNSRVESTPVVSFPSHSPSISTALYSPSPQADAASNTLPSILHLSFPRSMWTYDPLGTNEVSPRGDPDLTLTRTHRQKDRWAAATNS